MGTSIGRNFAEWGRFRIQMPKSSPTSCFYSFSYPKTFFWFIGIANPKPIWMI